MWFYSQRMALDLDLKCELDNRRVNREGAIQPATQLSLPRPMPIRTEVCTAWGGAGITVVELETKLHTGRALALTERIKSKGKSKGKSKSRHSLLPRLNSAAVGAGVRGCMLQMSAFGFIPSSSGRGFHGRSISAHPRAGAAWTPRNHNCRCASSRATDGLWGGHPKTSRNRPVGRCLHGRR
jgi:hypothetical protein